MALATPVLERNATTEEKLAYAEKILTEAERHNSNISSNYAKLINPEYKVSDIITKKQPAGQEKERALFAEPKIIEEKPYQVQNARATAEIFRTDSEINKRLYEVDSVNADDEEDNEDLRPTPTTIQYQTTAVKTNTDEGKIEIKKSTGKFAFTKRDKIIVAIALSVIVALFILIIINSAVISNLNADAAALKDTLGVSETTLSQVSKDKEEYLEESNILKVVTDFAEKNGMVKR